MSLIIAIYVPTGIVLSGDSRTTGTASQTVQHPQNPNTQLTVQTNVVLSDAADKVFLLYCRFGVGIFGEALVNNMPIAHYIEQFQSQSPNSPPANTQSLADGLLQFFRSLQSLPRLGFLVVGYDADVPWVVGVDVLNNSTRRVNINGQTNQLEYGIVRGGDTAIVDRLLSQPQFNPPFQVMHLQDAVDYSRHLIRTTIDQMRFEPRFATVGGSVDTLVVTASEARFLSRKSLRCS